MSTLLKRLLLFIYLFFSLLVKKNCDFRNLEGLCEEEPDIVLICSSILSTESVTLGIPFHKLKQDTIFADVLSVKEFPRNLFLDVSFGQFVLVCDVLDDMELSFVVFVVSFARLLGTSSRVWDCLHSSNVWP